MITNDQDFEEAVRQYQEMTKKAAEEMNQALKDGTLKAQYEAYNEKQKRLRKVRLWWGFLSLTLTILGVAFLVHFLLPITLLKVGIFALWLAIGLFTTR